MKRCVRALFLNPVAKSSEGMFTPNHDRWLMASVLVTGGNGFIGTHLCQYLYDSGYHVISLDTLHTNSYAWECITADIRDRLHFDGIDYIIHLAAQISVPRSIQNPDKTLSVNVEGTKSIISTAEKAGVKKIIFASSAAIYGDCQDIPINEKAPFSVALQIAAPIFLVPFSKLLISKTPIGPFQIIVLEFSIASENV